MTKEVLQLPLDSTPVGADAIEIQKSGGGAGSSRHTLVNNIFDALGDDINSRTEKIALDGSENFPTGDGDRVITQSIQGIGSEVEETGTTKTVLVGDRGKSIFMNNAAANTLTIPTGLTDGFTALVVQQGAGATTITAAAGVTLQGAGGSVVAGSCTIQTQYGAAVIFKRNGAETYLVSGDINTVA